MSTLLGRLQLSMSVAYQNALDNQNVNADLARAIAVDFANGTGSGQANAMFSDLRSLSSGASEDLDLAGSLVDAHGNTLTFATIKAIIIENPTENTVDITIGGASATQFVGPFGAATHTVATRPGGFSAFVAPKTGWTVTGGSVDLLKVLAGAAASTYRIHIIGTV